MEIWKNIEDFENKYMISNYGKVFSKSSNRVIKIYKSKNGYYSVSLSIKKGKQKRFLIHRLVAKHFINNPQNKPQVNHIDGDKSNNHTDNLEWVTAKENVRHAYEIGLRDYSIIINNGLKKSKKVYQLNIENNKTIKIWESASKIKKELGFDVSAILRCCHLKKDTFKGYRWRFEETLDKKYEYKRKKRLIL